MRRNARAARRKSCETQKLRDAARAHELVQIAFSMTVGWVFFSCYCPFFVSVQVICWKNSLKMKSKKKKSIWAPPRRLLATGFDLHNPIHFSWLSYVLLILLLFRLSHTRWISETVPGLRFVKGTSGSWGPYDRLASYEKHSSDIRYSLAICLRSVCDHSAICLRTWIVFKVV